MVKGRAGGATGLRDGRVVVLSFHALATRCRSGRLDGPLWWSVVSVWSARSSELGHRPNDPHVVPQVSDLSTGQDRTPKADVGSSDLPRRTNANARGRPRRRATTYVAEPRCRPGTDTCTCRSTKPGLRGWR